METKNTSLKVILLMLTIGVWVIVLQNSGVIPSAQNVKVINEINANVRGNVNADINGSVRIENEVDVNINAINGYHNAFYDHSYNGEYNRIPVYTRN